MPVRTDRIFLLIADVELAEAYKTKSVGTTANDFVQYIRIFERGYIYPKAVSVLHKFLGQGSHGGRLT